MFKNYFKIAVRNIARNRLNSFIHITGLGVAIAICISGYVTYRFTQSFDRFHENAGNIYLVNTQRLVQHRTVNMASSPTPLAKFLKENAPGIIHFTRLARTQGIFRYDNKVFNEQVSFIDEHFFDMFTFPMIAGNKQALKDKNNIVITDEIAQKYFGSTDVVGKQMLFNPTGEREYAMVVGGVIKKPETNSSIQLAICVPYERQQDMLGYDLESWGDWTSAAFIQTSNHTSAEVIRNVSRSYIQQINEANLNYMVHDFYMTPLLKLSFTTPQLANHPFMVGFSATEILVPVLVSFLVFLVACFNFVNMSIASASRRFMEIGIRKTLGSLKHQLVMQFMSENVILCFLALMVGLLLSKPFLGYFDRLFRHHHFILDYGNLDVVLTVIVLLVVTAVSSGLYPSLYISKFKPVEIFKGKQKIGETRRLIKVLLSIQLVISVIAILSGLVLYRNGKYIQTFDLGFDKDQVLVVPVHNASNYALLKNELSRFPDIVSIGASEHVVGKRWTAREVAYQEQTLRADVLNIGENYIQTTGMRLLQGVDFDSELPEQNRYAIIINEAMKRQVGIEDPVGQMIKLTNENPPAEYRIIGVVKDYYLNGLWEKVRPSLLKSALPDDYRFLYVQFDIHNLAKVSSHVENTWKTICPHLPYEAFYQSDILAETLTVTHAVKAYFIAVAAIVLFTSAMGLFALVSLNIVRRTKEIGIRRVFGASLPSVCYLISKEYITILMISGLIGCVLGSFLIETLLSKIWAYHVHFSMATALITLLITIFVVLITVGSKVVNLAFSNPVDSIRDE